MKAGRSFAVVVALILSLGLAAAGSRQPGPLGAESRSVDVVICIDTSGSMQALLDSARARVWDVVNELARMRPTPDLRVGLLSYGTDTSTEEDGWIIAHLDLTDDLDTVYAELMRLTTGGGEEYVGRAVDTALDAMSWSPDWNALRILFVAGNESVDQGAADHDFRVAADAAADRQIIVNALYAGNREQGISELWHLLAKRGRGNFSSIDPLTGTLQIPTPQDDALLALNDKLNATYIPYGPRGQDGLANQVAQDANASRLGVQSCSSRIVAKGSALYSNATWDLVDAVLEPGFSWDGLTLDQLPEFMRSMTNDERQAHVDHTRSVREAIQQQVQELSVKREAYIKAVLTREAGANGLGHAMLQAICEQALAKGFESDGC